MSPKRSRSRGRVAARIVEKLESTFSPSVLEIADESHKHVGHAGHRPEGETHFRVQMTAAAFAGKSRVARERMVHAAVGEELATRVHALSLTLRAPGEDEPSKKQTAEGH